MELVYMMILVFGLIKLEVVCNRGPEEGNHFEGDIMLTANQRRMIHSGDKTKRAAIIGYRWPNGVVPYRFHSSISWSSVAKNVILGAMREWSNTTCVTFKKRTNERGYLEFHWPTFSGCSSYVGYHGVRQRIELSQGCWHHGIVLHEIGHALGFFHEQSRTDRDKYVRILWQNISYKYWYNFMISWNTDSLGEPYDYGSIMHYRKNAFSKNGEDTIQTLNGAAIGQRRALSNGDIKQMNLMYRCSNTNPVNTTRPCPSDWFSFGDHCYFFSTATSSSWQNAQQSCQSKQAELLCVTSNSEWTFIVQHIGSVYTYWIGANDNAQEGTWVCGGQNLTFTWWYPNQPNNYKGNQDCAVILDYWYYYRWNDDECTNTNHRYICKASSHSN